MPHWNMEYQVLYEDRRKSLEIKSEKNMVCRVSKNNTQQITGGGSLPSVRIITLGKDEFYRVLLFAECSALGKPPLCRVPVVRRVLSL